MTNRSVLAGGPGQSGRGYAELRLKEFSEVWLVSKRLLGVSLPSVGLAQVYTYVLWVYIWLEQ